MLQRLSLAKVAGASGVVIARQLRAWGRLRRDQSDKPFPPAVRRKVDAFALQLRRHCAELPIVYFAEWVDPWSMGDLFAKVFPQDVALPGVAGGAFEVQAYALPDEGRIEQHIAQGQSLGHLPGCEDQRLVARVREAVECWSEAAPLSLLLLLREVVGGSVLDEEVKARLTVVPNWVSDSCQDIG